MPCRICQEVFLRIRLTARYCNTCERAFCEGEHDNFVGRGPAVCVRCFRPALTKEEIRKLQEKYYVDSMNRAADAARFRDPMGTCPKCHLNFPYSRLRAIWDRRVASPERKRKRKTLRQFGQLAVEGLNRIAVSFDALRPLTWPAPYNHLHQCTTVRVKVLFSWAHDAQAAGWAAMGGSPRGNLRVSAGPAGNAFAGGRTWRQGTTA